MIKKLNEMNARQSGIIKNYKSLSNGNLRKLLALDLVPGANIQIVSKYPTFVIRSSYSEVAIDAQLAAEIEVEFKD